MRKHSEIRSPERGNDRARSRKELWAQRIRGSRRPGPAGCSWGQVLFSSAQRKVAGRRALKKIKETRAPDQARDPTWVPEEIPVTHQLAATGLAPRRECILNQLKLSHGYN